ncbi:MAG: alanine racemase [Acidobacteriota bacterium]
MPTRRQVLKRVLAAAGGAAAWPATSRAAHVRRQQPAAAQPSPARTVTHVRDSAFDPRVEINAAHLAHNVAEVRRRVGGRPIVAVIKNNGYGCGTAIVGKILETLPGVAMLAVVKLSEAVALREAGIRKPVLLMGPLDMAGLDEALRLRIEPMVYTPIGDTFDRIAARQQQAVAIHVCVDTGIGRVGVPVREATVLIRDLAARSSVRIASTMMTFTEDPQLDIEQLARFNALLAVLRHDGVAFGFRHAASTFGLFQRPDAFLDAVRPGMAIFGIYPEPDFRAAGVMDLRPALSLKARVAYVKRLAKGDTAGYNRAYVAANPVWVATLSVGHADGWPRAAAQGARVLINGALYPVIATVSASHTIVEIGDAPAAAIGDTATLFGWEDGARPEDVSAACKVSVYDLTMHLNPLLPRTVV